MGHSNKSRQNLLRGCNSGELRRLMKAVLASGARYRQARNGIVVYGTPGTPPLVIHQTLSDHRAIKNLEAALGKIGIEVKGKK